jgi:NAD(P)H dehydrogenase (quinone)
VGAVTAPRVAVVVHSITGHTAALADGVTEGLRNGDVVPVVLTIEGAHIIEGRFRNPALLDQVDTCDAVVFAAPTFMGGPSAQFKAFADASSDRWEQQRWSGKLAAGVTTGSCPNGDQTSTLQYFTVLAAQHGMLWVGLDIAGGYDAAGRNRLGVQLGASACIAEGELPSGVELATARHLGLRLASLVVRGTARPASR